MSSVTEACAVIIGRDYLKYQTKKRVENTYKDEQLCESI